MAACSSLASIGKVIAFGCTVVSTVTRLRPWLHHAPASCAPPQALGQQQLQLVAEPFAPAAQVRALVREGVLKNSSPVKNWKYGSWTRARSTPPSASVEDFSTAGA